MKKLEFTIQGTKYTTHLKSIEDNIATVDVNGTIYEVEIHREIQTSKTPKLVRKETVKNPTSGQVSQNRQTPRPAATGNGVVAPLPGSIFKVLVKENDAVKVGDTLLVMEAMKMENDIKAESDGVVSAIKVKEGDAVLQGDVLIEM